MTGSDEALFQTFLTTGDQAAFAELHHRYAKTMESFLATFIGTGLDRVEDVIQDTFARVIEYSDRYDPSRPFKSYLYSIATNTAIDVKRYDNRSHRKAVSLANFSSDDKGQEHDLDPADTSAPCVGDELMANETTDRLNAALAGLPEQDRLLIEGVYLNDEPYEAVADRLGIKAGTAYTRMHRLLRQLRENWSALADEMAA